MIIEYDIHKFSMCSVVKTELILLAFCLSRFSHKLKIGIIWKNKAVF